MNSKIVYKSLIIILCLLIISFPESVRCEDGGDRNAIESSDEALKRALEYTGFDKFKNLDDSLLDKVAKKVILSDDETPFLHDKINNREIWQVTFDSVYLNLSGWLPSVMENQRPKTYNVYLDPDNGKLLKIVATHNNEKVSFRFEPDKELGKRLLENVGDCYHDFPDEFPNTNLLKVLDSAFPSNPISAKKIIAYYVSYSSSPGKEGPVWIIIGRGIRTMEEGIDSRRCVVDAKTGKMLFFDTYP